MVDDLQRALIEKDEAASALIQACLDLEIDRSVDAELRGNDDSQFADVMARLNRIPDPPMPHRTTIMVGPIHFLPATPKLATGR